MSQIFHRSTNTLSRVSILGGVSLLGGLIAIAYTMDRGSFSTDVAVVKEQPVPFSHRRHAPFLKCLECHQVLGWEMSYPAEERCMQCHATIRSESPAILGLARYYKLHKPVPWVRVYRLPDYVFFSHKAHYVKARIACEGCHGPVSERDVIVKEKPTSMSACVDCHTANRAPVTCHACHDR